MGYCYDRENSVENRATNVSQVAQDVNEYAECVTLVSSVVQVMVITSKLVEMAMEIKRSVLRAYSASL